MEQGHNKKEPVIENKNSLTYPSRTLDPPVTIIDQAKEIENAHSTLKMNVNSKLDVIVKQIRLLQEEAGRIINQAHTDMELHEVRCNFQKIVGQAIYLYDDPVKGPYFSKLSPEEWDNNPPHQFKGTYRLNIDRSFELIDDSDRAEEQI
jgi:hypothetical protein